MLFVTFFYFFILLVDLVVIILSIVPLKNKTPHNQIKTQ